MAVRHPSPLFILRGAIFTVLMVVLATGAAMFAIAEPWKAADMNSVAVIYSVFSPSRLRVGYYLNLEGDGGSLRSGALSRGSSQPLLYADQPVVDPACSPDGRQLAFIAGDRLYRMDVSGKVESWSLRDLAGGLVNRGMSTTLRVSANGDILIAPWYLRRLFLVNPIGETRSMPLENAQFSGDAAFSPDGEQVAMPFLRRNQPEVRLLSARSGTVEDILERAISASWSPDGSMISFVTTQGGDFIVRLIDNHVGVRVALRAPSSTSFSYMTNLTWSPDGQGLAYLYYSSNSPELHMWTGEGRGSVAIMSASTQVSNPCFLRFRPDALLGGRAEANGGLTAAKPSS